MVPGGEEAAKSVAAAGSSRRSGRAGNERIVLYHGVGIAEILAVRPKRPRADGIRTARVIGRERLVDVPAVAVQ